MMIKQKVNKVEKKNNRTIWQEQKLSLGRQLFAIRQQYGYSLEEVSHLSRIPMIILEDMESGIGHLNMGFLLHLCRFYRHHLKVEVGEAFPPLEPQL